MKIEPEASEGLEEWGEWFVEGAGYGGGCGGGYGAGDGYGDGDGGGGGEGYGDRCLTEDVEVLNGT